MQDLSNEQARRILEGDGLPTVAEGLDLIRLCESGRFRPTDDAEPASGWLEAAERYGVFLLPTVEFVDALASQLRQIGTGPVLEVASGAGRLAASLADRGLDVIATDPDPLADHVTELPTAEALRVHRPQAVLACWPPVDAGIEAAIHGTPSVTDTVWIIGRLAHETGVDPPHPARGWRATAWPDVDAHALCRSDFLESFTSGSLVSHVRTWHYHREAE